MRPIPIVVGATVTGLALLFAWPTSTNRPIVGAAPGPGPGTATAPATTATTAPATTTGVSGNFDGATAQTRWGPVQVRIVVANGVITAAKALQIPSGNSNDRQINAYAIPTLNSEVLQKQGKSIQMVSGATVTSGGYLQSLQDALNKASL